jgi:hypothetical protein
MRKEGTSLPPTAKTKDVPIVLACSTLESVAKEKKKAPDCARNLQHFGGECVLDKSVLIFQLRRNVQDWLGWLNIQHSSDGKSLL